MIFLLNKNKKPLEPIQAAVARKLLRNKQAVIHKMVPFTIRLKELIQIDTKEYVIKIDPGSKTTGIAIVCENEVVHLAELHHKTTIKKKMQDRRSFRSGRRSRNTRYRQARFLNRTRKDGWLPPSLQARIDGTISLVKKYQKLIPLTTVFQELVRFDTQKMLNPEISGVEYQQGELQGYEVREYLLEKFNRQCFYCEEMGIPLEIEHCHPKSRGGTNSVRNLTIACRPCNQEKGNQTPEEWLLKISKKISNRYKKTQKNIPKLKQKLTQSLKDTAAVNATKNKLKVELENVFTFIETSSGALTKMNRIKLNLPKTHYFDAVSVGYFTNKFRSFKTNTILSVHSKGRGSRYRSRINKFGFPIKSMPKTKIICGFISGDLIKAIIPKGKYKGTHLGFCSMRSTGRADIKNSRGVILAAGINSIFFKVIQRFDGYSYQQENIRYK
jgi:5-methylcytosine-specific restriction endonuclease McrA